MSAGKHPAQFNEPIIQKIDNMMQAYAPDADSLIDPFGGVGNVFNLGRNMKNGAVIVCNELEPEWAEEAYRNMDVINGWYPNIDMYVTNVDWLEYSWHQRDYKFGDRVPVGQFDICVTSPTYANRMADHHDARDGSDRITYKHRLGRNLTPGNSGAMQWGDEYRDFHRKAWAKVLETLNDNGLFIINTKDHYRQNERVPVTAWHHATLSTLGFTKLMEEEVQSRGMGKGANGTKRVPYETVSAWTK